MPEKVRRPGGRTADVSGRVADATLALLAQGGFHACTFQAVAAAAGVNRSTLYRRWPTEAAMVLDAIAAIVDAEIVVADTGSLAGDLRAALRRLAAFLDSPVGRASISAALHLEADAATLAQRRRLWARRWTAIAPVFARARARGELAAGVDEAALLAAGAGALYFRVIVSAEPLDARWIRTVAGLVARAAGG
ncbi:MAG: TetR/AcrR family transcriptional regulator [bacterium]|nr:TetR/AcrR family transcriptional regulator [bacterium]